MLPDNRKKHTNPKTDEIMLDKARDLRKSMTPEERKLWYVFLKGYPIKIYKQKVMGPFIMDFYCEAAKLGIEIDGAQHYYEDSEEYDKERTIWLERKGIKVLRFTNREINHRFRAVCEMIDGTILERKVAFASSLSVSSFGTATSPGGGGKSHIS